MARGCCLLEFLRRDATFSESLTASAHGRHPLLLPPPLPPAPRLLPPPPATSNATALASYAGGLRLAVDVMDQALQAILATATVGPSPPSCLICGAGLGGVD